MALQVNNNNNNNDYKWQKIDCGDFAISSNGTVLTTTSSDWINLSDSISTANINGLRELELRVEVLENKLRQNKIEDKYKVIYGE